MSDELKAIWNHVIEIWNFVVGTAASGQVITLGQILSVIVLLLAGYFGSKLLGFLVGRRLDKTDGSVGIRAAIVRIPPIASFFDGKPSNR